MTSSTIFLTTPIAGSLCSTRLLLRSLRSFGGELADATFWLFTTDPASAASLADQNTSILPLTIPAALSAYTFGDKVFACARAEALAPRTTRSLVWVDPNCLIVQPPALFSLGSGFDAAFRPVHIRNIGLLASDPLDAYWQGIYNAVGVEEIEFTVKSFVDEQVVRSYFNSHSFAINPRLGLMSRWLTLFQRLVGNASFQAEACTDAAHQIFLFQALLSALVVTSMDIHRLRLLPATYNYPCHLHAQVPERKRLGVLNDAVCFTYENLLLTQEGAGGLGTAEPLRAWLAENLPAPDAPA